MSHLSRDWDYSSRIIPTRYESRYHDNDFWRPRWELAPVQHHTPPFPTSLPPPPPEFSSSLVHYPTRGRQVSDFDVEMKRMNDEMGKMFKNMQMATPPASVDDWRLSENFRMENPVQHFGDGTRKFQLQFDMRQFKPEEIQVKTSGNSLTVYAKHDEKDPNKSVFREYNRSYVLPKDVKPERLTSKLSSEEQNLQDILFNPGAGTDFMLMQQSPLCEPIPIPAEPTTTTDRDDWRLWVGNLDTRVTEYSLLKILQKFGSLEKFDFLYHKVGPDAGKPRGYCFVSYDKQEDAEKAMAALNGKLALSKRLAVRWAHKIEDDEVKVKEVNKDADSTVVDMSTDAKIRAIEAKLRLMERSKEEMSLSSRPLAEPGTSPYSIVQQARENQSNKLNGKPYVRKERNK